MAVGLHLALFLIPADYTNIFLYVRNQFLAWSFLFSMVQILDFLKFHHMFGPWAIIISSLLVDLGKFMTVLFLFLIGFSMLVTAMNTPFYQLTEVGNIIIGLPWSQWSLSGGDRRPGGCQSRQLSNLPHCYRDYR